MKKTLLILILGCFSGLVIAQDAQDVPDIDAEEELSIQTEPSPEQPEAEEVVDVSPQVEDQEPVVEDTVIDQVVEEPAPALEEEPMAEEPVALPSAPEQEAIVEVQEGGMPSEPAATQPVSAEVPVPTAEEPIDPEDVLPEIEGIDTVDLESPQGNWLFKRIWWERSEQKYEKIRAIVQSIFESRMRFFSIRNEVDKTILDPFYIGVGLSQGELQGLLGHLVETLEKERADQGALNATERSVLDALRQEKVTLEQMHKDVMAINQLDHDIDDALSQLMEQINRVRAYDSDAWQAFKEIARVLDDTKARELYYRVNTAGRNIKDIRAYIDISFTPHFDQLVDTVREQVNNVQNSISALKEKGIDFKLQVERLTKPPVVSQEEDDDDEDEQEESQGIISSIFSGIGSFFSSIWGIIRWPYDLIFGGSDEVEDIDIDIDEQEE